MNTTQINAQIFYKSFVNKVLSKYSRVPNNEEVSEFLYIFELLNEGENWNKYVSEKKQNEAQEFAEMFKDKWAVARQGRTFDISHEDILRCINGIDE